MICAQCKLEGRSSTITEMPHMEAKKKYFPSFDEDGGRHYHDQNRYLRTYKCSNNHIWSLEKVNECWCGWKSITETTAQKLIEMTDNMDSRAACLVPKIVTKFEE